MLENWLPQKVEQLQFLQEFDRDWFDSSLFFCISGEPYRLIQALFDTRSPSKPLVLSIVLCVLCGPNGWVYGICRPSPMSQIKKHDLPNSNCIFISFNFILYLPNWPKKLKIQKHKSCFSLCVCPAKLQSPIGNHEASSAFPAVYPTGL